MKCKVHFVALCYKEAKAYDNIVVDRKFFPIECELFSIGHCIWSIIKNSHDYATKTKAIDKRADRMRKENLSVNTKIEIKYKVTKCNVVEWLLPR